MHILKIDKEYGFFYIEIFFAWEWMRYVGMYSYERKNSIIIHTRIRNRNWSSGFGWTHPNCFPSPKMSPSGSKFGTKPFFPEKFEIKLAYKHRELMFISGFIWILKPSTCTSTEVDFLDWQSVGRFEILFRIPRDTAIHSLTWIYFKKHKYYMHIYIMSTG